jgi:hypothetical protein
MHKLPQRVKPALQVKPHLEAAHAGELFGGAEHTVPQAPQFEVSVTVLVHAPLQSV